MKELYDIPCSIFKIFSEPVTCESNIGLSPS